MSKVLDFHIHSRYSRACSKDLTLPNIAFWAARKGVDIVGTGDFTHPKWFAEIEGQLQQQGNGLLKLKTECAQGRSAENVQFILSGEISSIYSHNGKVRRIHNLLLVPSLQDAARVIAKLEQRGAKLGSDGRPIVGISSKELLATVLDISDQIMLIPAHVWTPHFGLFGSKSGYDSVEECFEEMSAKITCLETGLSADPQMFWRISQMDRFTLISCSDPHSLHRIGRECNVFDLKDEDVSYAEITKILTNKDSSRFLYTLEYYPEEGRYHYDGHRDCKVSAHPSTTAKLKGVCPNCGRQLTVGVLSRAEQLSDRPEGYMPEGAIPFKRFVVLEEIIAASYGIGTASKKVQQEYLRITEKRSELDILINLKEEELERFVPPRIAKAIIKMRSGQIRIDPGYDGEYGKIHIFDSEPQIEKENQTLF